MIEDDRITEVGEDIAAPADGARVIDANDRIVMPGLVDFHYHTALGKGWSDHLPLWEYLQTCWYPMIRAMSPEDAYWAALASYSESIKCGVTAVNDMYRRLEALADAAEKIGIAPCSRTTSRATSTISTRSPTTSRPSARRTAPRTGG